MRLKQSNTKGLKRIRCLKDHIQTIGKENVKEEYKVAIYAPMIFTAPCVMFLMFADTLRGQVGGGWALENRKLFGPGPKKLDMLNSYLEI